MRYAFDLDGTLVNSRDVVYDSYRQIGINPPPDFFGKPFLKWYTGDPADAEKVHRLKALVYDANIGLVKPLPLMTLFSTLANRWPDEVAVITGASHAAITSLRRVFPILERVEVVYGLTIEAKARLLNEQHVVGGIVFDDDAEAAQYLRQNTGWTVCCIS